MTVERDHAGQVADGVPKSRRATSMTYDIHGVTVSISADHPDIEFAIHARLRHFAAVVQGSAMDLTIDPRRQAGVPPCDLDVGAAAARPIFDVPLGTARYFERADRLEMSHQDAVRVSCAPAAGCTQIWIDQRVLHDVWPVTPSLFSVALLEMLRRRTRYGVHAAGLALGDAGLLLAGASGSGKSTLALGCDSLL